MFVFIYYWLVERTKYFLVSFCFFCSQTQKEKENAAKPQKNLRLGPKIIIIIFSFKMIFCQVFERTTNTTQAALQPPIVGGPHTLSSSRCRFLPVPPPELLQPRGYASHQRIGNEVQALAGTSSSLRNPRALGTPWWSAQVAPLLWNDHKAFQKHYFCKWRTALLVGILCPLLFCPFSLASLSHLYHDTSLMCIFLPSEIFKLPFFCFFYHQRIDFFFLVPLPLLILPGFTSCIYSLSNKECLKLPFKPFSC